MHYNAIVLISGYWLKIGWVQQSDTGCGLYTCTPQNPAEPWWNHCSHGSFSAGDTVLTSIHLLTAYPGGDKPFFRHAGIYISQSAGDAISNTWSSQHGHINSHSYNRTPYPILFGTAWSHKRESGLYENNTDSHSDGGHNGGSLHRFHQIDGPQYIHLGLGGNHNGSTLRGLFVTNDLSMTTRGDVYSSHWRYIDKFTVIGGMWTESKRVGVFVNDPQRHDSTKYAEECSHYRSIGETGNYPEIATLVGNAAINSGVTTFGIFVARYRSSASPYVCSQYRILTFSCWGYFYIPLFIWSQMDQCESMWNI